MKYLAACLVAVVAACSSSPSETPDGGISDAAVDGAPGVPDPDHSLLATDLDVAFVGRDQVRVTATIRDGVNAPVSGVDAQLVVSSGTVTQAPPTDASGVTTAVWTNMTPGSQTVDLVVNGVTLTSHTVLWSKPAVRLAFSQQPTTSIAGGPIPTFAVSLLDEDGNLVPVASDHVEISLASSPAPGAVLGGIALEATSNGIATFPVVIVTPAGSGYTLRARAPGELDAVSAAFDVLPGDPDPSRTKISAVPASLEANGIETAAIRVETQNQFGIVIPGATVSVSATGSNNVLSPASGPTDSRGTMTALLSSTTAEVKSITATVGAITLHTTVNFHPPGCTLQLPGPPGVPLEGESAAVLVTDVDGDGHLDAIVGNNFVRLQISVYRGHGDATFDAPFDIPAGAAVSELAVGDLDGDGKLDIAFVAGSSVSIALGTGGGQFAAPIALSLPFAVSDLVTGDFDRDGKLDLAVMNGGSITIERGAGNGTFTAGQQISNIAPSDLRAADVNGDSKLDLVFAGSAGVSAVIGTGSGTFAAPVTSVGSTAGNIVIGDFNNDGKPDCAIAMPGHTLQPYLGNGDGTFTAVGSAIHTAEYNGSAGDTPALIALDVNADSRADLVVGEGTSLSVLSGGGDGSFSLADVYAPDASHIVTGDIDEDGVSDVVAIGHQLLSVIRGESAGTFVAPRRHAETSPVTLADASADFDGDGHADLVTLSQGGAGALLSHPDGSLTDMARVATPNPPFADLQAADVTGDGHADLMYFYGTTFYVSAGDGLGGFAPFTSQVFSANGWLHFADLDRDGKQDLVLYEPGSFALAHSNGDGTFGPLETHTGVLEIVTADMTGDGITDVAAATGLNVAVFPGDGAGSVGSPVSGSATVLDTDSIFAGDIDGDGIVDVVISGQDPLSLAYGLEVHRGLGGGVLGPALVTPEPGMPRSFMTRGLRLVDVTGDGVLDIVIPASEEGIAVIAGYGDGYFRQRVWRYSAPIGLAEVFASDHDEDSLTDVAFASGLGVGIAFNRGCVP